MKSRTFEVDGIVQIVKKLDMFRTEYLFMKYEKFWKLSLKSDSHLPKKFLLHTSLESALKMMRNAFYLKVFFLFVHKVFKFLSWLFGPVEKTAS